MHLAHFSQSEEALFILCLFDIATESAQYPLLPAVLCGWGTGGGEEGRRPRRGSRRGPGGAGGDQCRPGG
ncbi:hypothetical protein DPMN_146240 [Dreissena polymorpha]|uniref:Uncharacterized protein n=1 Tax=Dreissena polymorpha TaxID=45954 RepID=A0A9D4IY88_DREPO|nr:hypothetical protein DPMN_146240 [Dreissena polymorpha]